jgi:single-strand DNA-binding protein
MTYTATGTIRHIGEAQQVNEKFKKRELVIAVQDGNFTQYPKFELTQDKCSLLDNYAAGQEVTVSFNLRGNEYTRNGETLYFTSLQAWRIEAGAPQVGASATPAYVNNDSDLPF